MAYVNAEMELVKFEAEDILATSSADPIYTEVPPAEEFPV